MSLLLPQRNPQLALKASPVHYQTGWYGWYAHREAMAEAGILDALIWTPVLVSIVICFFVLYPHMPLFGLLCGLYLKQLEYLVNQRRCRSPRRA